jgi:hypothetical protein
MIPNHTACLCCKTLVMQAPKLLSALSPSACPIPSRDKLSTGAAFASLAGHYAIRADISGARVHGSIWVASDRCSSQVLDNRTRRALPSGAVAHLDARLLFLRRDRVRNRLPHHPPAHPVFLCQLQDRLSGPRVPVGSLRIVPLCSSCPFLIRVIQGCPSGGWSARSIS